MPERSTSHMIATYALVGVLVFIQIFVIFYFNQQTSEMRNEVLFLRATVFGLADRVNEQAQFITNVTNQANLNTKRMNYLETDIDDVREQVRILKNPPK